MSKHVYVDGDILVYRCGWAGEKTKYLVEAASAGITKWDSMKEAKEDASVCGGTIWSRKQLDPIENVLHTVKVVTESIKEKTGADQMTIFLSGKKNFRDDIAVTKEYKGNRDLQQRPTYYKDIKEYLINVYGAVVTSGIEADDALGIALSGAGDAGVIATIDKDLDQIAGWHYNWVDDKLYRVGRREADFALYTQIISGDATDNVPGVEGMGAVKAARALEGAESTADLFRRSWSVYCDRYGTSQRTLNYYLEQARLVYICRTGPDDRYHPPAGVDLNV